MAAAFSGGPGQPSPPRLLPPHLIVQHKGLPPGPARWGFVCGSRGGGPDPPCVGAPNPEPGGCGRAVPKGVGRNAVFPAGGGGGGVPSAVPPPRRKALRPL